MYKSTTLHREIKKRWPSYIAISFLFPCEGVIGLSFFVENIITLQIAVLALRHFDRWDLCLLPLLCSLVLCWTKVEKSQISRETLI